MTNKQIPSVEIPKTICQSIYSYLKDYIINKKLEPNQRINEKEIAEVFRVSRTPVREAVIKLAAEGFVEIVSHREPVVKSISYKELEEIFQVMAVLDSLAAGLVVDQINAQEIAKLEKLTNRMGRHFKLNEVEEYVDVNYVIHDRLWGYLSDINGFLQQQLRACASKIRMFSYALNSSIREKEILKTSMDKHREILETLKAKNKQKLKTVMLEHWIPPVP